jgi:hypothetical protein
VDAAAVCFLRSCEKIRAYLKIEIEPEIKKRMDIKHHKAI